MSSHASQEPWQIWAARATIFVVRFRYLGKEYKKSLKVRDETEAENAKNLVEVTIHRLLTGQTQIPGGIDPGDYIVSGGTLTEAVARKATVATPTARDLATRFLQAQRQYLAPSTHKLFTYHLNHWLRHLGRTADTSADRVTHANLEDYLQQRIGRTSTTTAAKERLTLMQTFRWAVARGELPASPAANLAVIKEEIERPRFRTLAEIEAQIERGGLVEDEVLDLWECVYLSPDEIAQLLETVRNNAQHHVSLLLHVISAFTGMRRGEVLRLQWTDVDFQNGIVQASSRKQSRKRSITIRTIALHPELLTILADWKSRTKGQFVLIDPKTQRALEGNRANRLFWQPLRGTDWCLDSAKNWFKIGFHTYRHSFASNLAVASVDQRVIDEFMGHSTEQMQRRYRHLFPNVRRQAITRLSYTVIKNGEVPT